MFVHNDGAGDGQTLAGAFAYFLGGEKRLKNSSPHGLGNAGASVADADFHPVAVATRADADDTLGLPTELVLDGMGGVDHDVEDDLVELSRQTGNQRQGRVEVSLQIGDVLPLVAADSQGALDGAIKVNRNFGFGARVREFFHGMHDFGHALHAGERLGDGLWYLLLQVGQVDCLNRLLDFLRQALGEGLAAGGFQQPVELPQQSEQVVERILHEKKVVPDELRGGVDLVRDAGGELADGLEFLG